MAADPVLKIESLSIVAFICSKTYVISSLHFVPVGQTDL